MNKYKLVDTVFKNNHQIFILNKHMKIKCLKQCGIKTLGDIEKIITSTGNECFFIPVLINER